MNCKLPIRSEIYNCTFKNTNKVSIIFLSFFCFRKQKNFHNYAYFALIVTVLLSGSSTQCSRTLHYASVFCSAF